MMFLARFIVLWDEATESLQGGRRGWGGEGENAGEQPGGMFPCDRDQFSVRTCSS